MAEQGLEGSQPVDLSKHPSGIVPTLQQLDQVASRDWRGFLTFASGAVVSRLLGQVASKGIIGSSYLLGEHAELILLKGDEDINGRCNSSLQALMLKEKRDYCPACYSSLLSAAGNIVSTVNLDCKLDLKAIALQARNAEYNPKRFAAVIMRIREPKTTALIFASGKMVCTGAKSEQQSKLAARKYARIIQKLGFPAKFKDFKIQNIVGSCDVKFPIRLEGLAYSHGAFCSYEPELFPGLIYRMKQPKIVLLIFVSGKIVITGAKVREETYLAFENIYPVLTEFRKNQQWYTRISKVVGQCCQIGANASEPRKTLVLAVYMYYVVFKICLA
ncbi:hypothetical protein ZIOFF_048145 [Zingiber officinale]|uniref:Uncharacterized protein n=1 Tax=Zingiber officinale TaxID=94328 RepID=A0A8J5FP83_ZINOF|nr:hypothetical protein ZIOFF_048145 [Zingiber officinale]